MIKKPTKGMRVMLSEKGIDALFPSKKDRVRFGILTSGLLLADDCLRVKWDNVKEPSTYPVSYLDQAGFAMRPNFKVEPIAVLLPLGEMKKLVTYDLVKDKATGALFEKRQFEGEEMRYSLWVGGFCGDLSNIKEEEVIT